MYITIAQYEAIIGESLRIMEKKFQTHLEGQV